MDIEKLCLVWNADKGLRADLLYVLKKLRGIEECALCGLTHGAIGETSEWKAYKREFDAPFEGLYRDRVNEEQSRAIGDDFPCVLAQTPDGPVKLLGRDEIEGCEGDIERFAERLRAAIDARAEASAVGSRA